MLDIFIGNDADHIGRGTSKPGSGAANGLDVGLCSPVVTVGIAHAECPPGHQEGLAGYVCIVPENIFQRVACKEITVEPGFVMYQFNCVAEGISS